MTGKRPKEPITNDNPENHAIRLLQKMRAQVRKPQPRTGAMRAIFTMLALAGTAPAGALACTPIAVTKPSVTYGEQCTISYTDTKSPQYVSSYAVVDLGGGIIRQQFHNGVCDSGERIVAYFDCAAGTGAWLGGPINAPGLPQPPPDATGYVAPILGEGVDGAFISKEEPRLAGGPHPEAVLARAQRLPWVTQSGRIESARLTMDGKRFDLNCGCKLFYPDSAN